MLLAMAVVLANSSCDPASTRLPSNQDQSQSPHQPTVGIESAPSAALRAPSPVRPAGVETRRKRAVIVTPVLAGGESERTTPKVGGSALERAVRARLGGRRATATKILAQWLSSRPSTTGASASPEVSVASGAVPPEHAAQSMTPPSLEEQRVCVLLGLLLFEQVRYAEAESQLAACSVPDGLADRVAWVRGELLRGLGRPLDALVQYKRVTRFHRSPLAPRAGFRIGDAYYEADKHKAALKKYRSMLQLFPAYPGRTRIQLRIAMSHAALGRRAKAARALDQLTRDALPGSDASLAAQGEIDFLVANGTRRPRRTFEDRFEWAQKLRRKRRWAEALEIFVPLLNGTKRRRQLAELHYEIGRCHESMDLYPKAWDSMKTSRSFGGASSQLVDMKVRLLRKMGKTEEAVAIAIRRAGKGKRVRGMVAAEMYYRDGKYKQAAKLYRKYMRTKFSRAAKYHVAWVEYRAGNYKRAEKAFTYLAGKSGIGRKRNALYWLGRVQQKMGKKEQALDTFTRVYLKNAGRYYGIMAANRILELGDAKRYSELTDVPPSEVPDDKALGRPGGRILWTMNAPAKRPNFPAASRDKVAAELREAAESYGGGYPELWRALDLYVLGLDAEARMELRIAKAEASRSRRAPARLLAKRASNLFMDNRARKRGMWGSSMHRRLKLDWKANRQEEERLNAARKASREFAPLVRRLMDRVDDPYWRRRRALSGHWRTLRGVPDETSRPVFARAYPLGFEEVLRRETSKNGLSPYLMGAIARVESGFNHLAISVAGARGLLQVMPVTGNLIALRRGDTEFAVPNLLNPHVSIEYGSWYMSELIRKFRGQEPLAIISYNCGPHRVQQWLARKGPHTELDEFIEEVPYSESRNYVKSVLGYIGRYRRTHEGRADLWVGQKLIPEYLDNINW